MSTTEVKGEIPLDELQRIVSDALGRAYKVTATSDSTLKIRRLPLVTARIHVRWHGDRTTLQAAPGEVWILQGINALTIYPKLRRTLTRAFTPAPGSRARTAPAALSDSFGRVAAAGSPASLADAARRQGPPPTPLDRRAAAAAAPSHHHQGRMAGPPNRG